uniref:Uncharacterized protein n=1 Tax=Nelumbo nucifera TaxID=4432 RepID=A0A822ZW42_NELNU|nr:TPA_asm: hypothetical protein HUJ06_018647 [Nelumbo nucifera]
MSFLHLFPLLSQDANRENALNDRESSPSNCDTNSQR